MKQRTEQEHEDRIARLIRRIDRYPNSPGLFQGLGRAYYEQRKLDEAEAAYRKSLSLAPDDPWTNLYLGTVFFARRQYRKALVWSKQASKLAPNLSIAFICIGDAHCGLRNYDKAVEMYRKAMEIDPSDDLGQKQLDRLDAILSKEDEPQ